MGNIVMNTPDFLLSKFFYLWLLSTTEHLFLLWVPATSLPPSWSYISNCPLLFPRSERTPPDPMHLPAPYFAFFILSTGYPAKNKRDSLPFLQDHDFPENCSLWSIHFRDGLIWRLTQQSELYGTVFHIRQSKIVLSSGLEWNPDQFCPWGCLGTLKQVNTSPSTQGQVAGWAILQQEVPSDSVWKAEMGGGDPRGGPCLLLLGLLSFCPLL